MRLRAERVAGVLAGDENDTDVSGRRAVLGPLMRRSGVPVSRTSTKRPRSSACCDGRFAGGVIRIERAADGDARVSCIGDGSMTSPGVRSCISRRAATPRLRRVMLAHWRRPDARTIVASAPLACFDGQHVIAHDNGCAADVEACQRIDDGETLDGIERRVLGGRYAARTRGKPWRRGAD